MTGEQEDDKLFLIKEELFMRKWYAGCFKNMFFDTGLLNFLRVRCAINLCLHLAKTVVKFFAMFIIKDE